jgi:hypothetical protein
MEGLFQLLHSPIVIELMPFIDLNQMFHVFAVYSFIYIGMVYSLKPKLR